ncbi:putative mitochondrial hypothetical protein [Leptomonas pyrrhocoris]|uniref:Uncharacterized protein n=1 Tax=Leptomonas pyrrhocoris TaxID=157538 RepID=A0A0M9G4E3_LEPPY|nr:putative mitochondrial hypothetical protein [Leptomonas pyrrhocoris]KPA82200.1 putative mitochondrial hypothetical protein [Leptomonas pyrrhocoris]|eukprot:XP_015660639.1 putative mitochondrial hypothetical protein [Leptomonas pyrrhocoris]
MRSLVRQRASAAARLRCSSSFHRFTPTPAFTGGFTGLLCCCATIENDRRCYSTTTVLHKQLPTSAGSSSAAAGGPTPNAVRNNRSRKQSTAVASGGAGSAAVAVEPELEAAPTTVDATVSRNAAVESVSASHRTGKATTISRVKASKRGRRKQEGSASLRSGTSSVTPTAATGARKRQPDVAVALPPVEPPMAMSTDVAEDATLASCASTSARGKGVRNTRGKPRTTNAKTADPTASAAAGEPRTNSTGASQPLSPPPPSLGSAPPVYYTHYMQDTTPRTEEQRMAERCSITKLIMVSASVSFLFTALPRTEGQLKMYVQDMNRVQVPNAAAATAAALPSAESAMTTISPSLTSKQFHELRQRLCAEQYSTNTVFIHVREMEQLVPPLHLQPPTINEGVVDDTKRNSTTADDDAQGQNSSSSSSTPGRHVPGGKTRGRRGRRSRAHNSTASSASAVPVPPLPVLSPVERLLALQMWKKTAVCRAKETQARHPIPAHFHTITRVRFHDPHQTDLTVAMGGGLNKSTDSVLRAIVRNTHREDGVGSSGEWLAGEEEDEDGDGGLPPFPMPDPDETNAEVVTEAAADIPEPEQPAFVSSPYAVKPLLTVCASCVPRREAWIGTCSPKPSAATLEAESVYAVRPLPTVPRFSTRITIMLEHDEMDPADLVSLAEISTTRKPVAAAAAARASSASAFDMHSDVSVRGGGVDVAGGGAADAAEGQSGRARAKRPLQLYCLVQDAGEY